MSMTEAGIEALLNGPALAPPAGVTVHLGTYNGTFHSAAYVFPGVTMALATISVFIRINTKAFLDRNFLLEDWTMLIAWVVSQVGVWLPSVELGRHGFGNHQWNVRVKDLEDFLLYLYIGAILYGVSICLIKISILQQYLRVFRVTGRRDLLFWACHTMIVLNAVFYIICMLIEIFSCNPIPANWDVLITDAKCINKFVLDVVTAIVNTISDLIIWILPLPTIWNLQMNRTRKISISIIFSAGLLACVASGIRVYYAFLLACSTDVTWYGSLMAVMIPIELSLGMISGCLPVIPKFLKSVCSISILSSVKSSLKSSGQTMKSGGGTKQGTVKDFERFLDTARGNRKERRKSYGRMPESPGIELELGMGGGWGTSGKVEAVKVGEREPLGLEEMNEEEERGRVKKQGSMEGVIRVVSVVDVKRSRSTKRT